MPEHEVPVAKEAAEPWTQLWMQTARPAWDLGGEDPVAWALRGHWQDQWGWLQSRRHILDAGSGPAVLARLLQPLVRSPDVPTGTVWTCVDQALIDVSSLSDLPMVQGVFGRPWESLPPPAVGASALVSNYGLEYVSRDHLVRTCASWLAPGGRLHAVMHARGSVIDQQSAQGLADLNLILDELGFPERVAALLEARVAAPSEPTARMMHGVEVRDAFNACVNSMKMQLDERGARQGALIEWLMVARDLVQTVSEGTLQATLDRLQRLRAAYDAERSRLQAMRACALSQSDLEVLGQQLVRDGFQGVQLGSLEASTGPVAWVLEATRAQGST
jgi:hypothetical protein